MTNIKRSERDPRTITTQGRTRHPWPELIKQAKAEPGQWFEYHGWADKPSDRSPVRVYADRIKRGVPEVFSPAGTFDAVARGKILFVRFLG